MFTRSLCIAVKLQRSCLASTPKTMNESMDDLPVRRITRSMAAKEAMDESLSKLQLQSEGSADAGYPTGFFLLPML